MENAISLHNVTKSYDGFTLDHITLDIPRGSIVGLVGENGAGKTTLLKCILQMIHMDNGSISIGGKPLGELPADWKEDVGVIMSGIDFASAMTADEMGKCMKLSYKNWQQDVFADYLRKFKIDGKKKIKDYSKGMKMKLNLAMALSHNAKLLIFDEATSGLDPIVRDDILDILLEFIQDESHAALLSSHITSDLEKVADYIAFLHEGRLKFCLNKDEMLYDYGAVKCSAADFERIPKEFIKGYRKNSFGYEVLIHDKQAFALTFPGLVLDNTSIEEIILFMVKGEKI